MHSSHLQEIFNALQNHPLVVLKASPGTGKTTKVPASLLQQVKSRILVIEPRKLAARWASHYVSQNLAPAHLVGHIYRFENATTKDTRLIYLTEGTFLKYIEDNPLTSEDVVILDEFHERHLTTDLSFGWLIARYKKPTPPKILLMSATTDEELFKKIPLDYKFVEVSVATFPLEIEYAPTELEWQKRDLESKVMWGLQKALTLPGDILVFLPGFAEIQRAKNLIERRMHDQDITLLILHSQMSSSDQEIRAKENGKKIILATNIAESSITIDGVRVVIDAGLDRQNIYQHHSKRFELQTIDCSQSSCIQRAGRAARQDKGWCIRLFPENSFSKRDISITPEVLRSDLSESYLKILQLGLDPEAFFWMNPPPQSSVQNALSNLESLNLVEDKKITTIGLEIKDCPLPLSLARVWYEGRETLAQDSFDELCQIISRAVEPNYSQKIYQRLKRRSSGASKNITATILKFLKMNLARGRSQDFILASSESHRIQEELLKKISIKDKYFIVLDFPIRINTLFSIEDEESLYSFCDIKITEELIDHKATQTKQWFIGSLIIKSEIKKIENAQMDFTHVAKEWLNSWKDSQGYLRWAHFQKYLFKDLRLDDFEWDLFIEEFCLDKTLSPGLQAEFIKAVEIELQLYFDPSFQKKLDQEFPTEFQLHPKKRLKVHYFSDKNPMIESYIQDFYGQKSHPSLLRGELPFVIGLWGPHGRTLQITSDLLGFWRNHYPSIMKELKIDYPRHFWAEDPLSAEAILRKPLPQK